MPEKESAHKLTEVDGWLMLHHAWKYQVEGFVPTKDETHNPAAEVLRESQDAILLQRPFDITNVKGLLLTSDEYKHKLSKEQHADRKAIWDDNT